MTSAHTNLPESGVPPAAKRSFPCAGIPKASLPRFLTFKTRKKFDGVLKTSFMDPQSFKTGMEVLLQMRSLEGAPLARCAIQFFDHPM